MADKLFLMPLDWDALLTDEKVIAMSDQAFRAYLHLLRAAWQSDVPGTLPDNDGFLARVTGLGPETWKQVRPEIQGCFRVSNGRWNQKKMRQIYDAVAARRKAQSEKGKNGAAKRWAIAQALPAPLPEQSPGIGNQSQNQDKETSSPCPKSASPPPDEARKFVDWFIALLAETGAPVAKITPSVRENWADCYDKMLRLDGRTKEQVKAVCRWARNDPFWRRNFLSPMKLRDKKDGVQWFDLFSAKLADDATPKRPPPAPDIYTEPADWRQRAAAKWPDMQMPERWDDLSSTLRNDLLGAKR